MKSLAAEHILESTLNLFRSLAIYSEYFCKNTLLLILTWRSYKNLSQFSSSKVAPVSYFISVPYHFLDNTIIAFW